jgi:hypothetical protein
MINYQLYNLVVKIPIATKLYQLPNTYGDTIHLIIFCREDLSDPIVDPLLIYYENGMKHYIIVDQDGHKAIFLEVDLFESKLVEIAKKLFDNSQITIKQYKDIILYCQVRKRLALAARSAWSNRNAAQAVAIRRVNI